MLSTLFVALLVGFAIQALGRPGDRALAGIAMFQKVVFKGLAMIMWVAPIGTFGAIAGVVGQTGVDALKSLALLMAAFYATCFLFVVVVLGTLLKVVTGLNIWSLFRYLGREFLLIVSTSSSGTALPRLIAKMEHLGVSRPVVGIVVPTGYSVLRRIAGHARRRVPDHPSAGVVASSTTSLPTAQRCDIAQDVPVQTFDELVERARSLASSGRFVLGIAGAPGSGKSTLAARLSTALGPTAVLVPLDGFHLANAELDRLGRRDRKGAPDTFDVAGYVSLLRRLREPGPEMIYAPTFERGLEEPVAGAIPVDPQTPLVITEGNYLLLDEGPWAAVRPLLDEAWFVDVDEALRIERLMARHVFHGKTPEAARRWTQGSDQANALLVQATRLHADLVVPWAR